MILIILVTILIIIVFIITTLAHNDISILLRHLFYNMIKMILMIGYSHVNFCAQSNNHGYF